MMKLRVSYIVLQFVFLFLCTFQAYAEEPVGNFTLGEVVVTATRTLTPAEEVASSVTVITEEDIKRTGQTHISEIIRGVEGLDAVNSGGTGQNTAVFLRGANSEHTLVLLDGVEMNDPSSPGRSFNFATLTADNIERIEILRGPQSTLYGSDALAGVINIITKKGEGASRVSLFAEGGSFGTLTEGFSLNGGTESSWYSLGASKFDTAGISSAGTRYGNTEKDGHHNTTISGRFGISPVEKLDIELFGRFITSKTDLDNNSGSGGDDPNNTAEVRQYMLKPQLRALLFNNMLETKFSASLANHDRNFNNGTDSAHPLDLSFDAYDSQSLRYDWQNNIFLNPSNTFTIGAEHQEEKASSAYYSESAWGPYTSSFEKKSAKITSVYVQEQLAYDDLLYTSFGARLDRHDRFGQEITFRIAPAYLVRSTGTRIKGTYASGFKGPSLYQLYSQYGNSNLKAERNRAWDAGIEQGFLQGKLILGAVYFNNSFESLIDFDSSAFTYRNLTKAETKGVEISLSASPSDTLSINANYTYTNAKDKTTDSRLVRRPENKAKLSANYSFLKNAHLNLTLLHVGTRDDWVFDPVTWQQTTVKLDEYTLVNLAFSYGISENFELFGRVDNLFDKDYEEVKGYGTPGIGLYAGVKGSF